MNRGHSLAIFLALLASAGTSNVWAQALQGAGISGGSEVTFSGDGNQLNGPQTYSAGGNTVTFSNTGELFSSYTVGNQYGGSGFPGGTNILYGNGQGQDDLQGLDPEGPLTITFSDPVTDFGFNAEEYTYGDELFSFSVYDGADLLDTFSESGFDPFELSFIGASADPGYDITSVVLSDAEGDNIGVGPVTFDGVMTYPPPMIAASSTPEPESLILEGTGLAALLLRRRWNCRT
jgi:hypothetical protein